VFLRGPELEAFALPPGSNRPRLSIHVVPIFAHIGDVLPLLNLMVSGLNFHLFFFSIGVRHYCGAMSEPVPGLGVLTTPSFFWFRTWKFLCERVFFFVTSPDFELSAGCPIPFPKQRSPPPLTETVTA